MLLLISHFKESESAMWNCVKKGSKNHLRFNFQPTKRQRIILFSRAAVCILYIHLVSLLCLCVCVCVWTIHIPVTLFGVKEKMQKKGNLTFQPNYFFTFLSNVLFSPGFSSQQLLYFLPFLHWFLECVVPLPPETGHILSFHSSKKSDKRENQKTTTI